MSKKQTEEQTKEKKPTGAGKQLSNEEQMKIRQSAPQPTASDYIGQQMAMQGMMPDQMGQVGQMGAMNGFNALAAPIGKEAVQKAALTLSQYKQGKAMLETRIVENEQWYKLRHWECMRKKQTGMVEPSSGWLVNCILNKHADAMDNFPSPNILPREEGDKADAEMLTSILPVILDQNDFEKTYSDVQMYKIKNGTGVYGIYWDSSKLNGLGDIAVRKIDVLNLFWEPGVTDIQDSRNMFHVQLVDNEVLLEQYPQLEGKLGTSTFAIAKYIYDDSINLKDCEKSCVIDWYYKKRNSQGKQVLHYCKFVNEEVLFATENDQRFSDRGYYDHGMYPFEFDTLFQTEGTPTGFGYIDIGKSAQEYIDRGNQAIMQNLLSNARPRYFIRSDGSVNEAEYGDMTKDFVHTDGNLGQDSILPIQGKPLSEIYVAVINNKIDELKETTGNRDISTGGTASGITAASAIAALQESGSKLSRDANKASYRVFRNVCLRCIELIRQFYDLPRCFRIIGQNGVARFVQYSNAGILPQNQGIEFGLDMGLRIPLFDVEVSAQKQSPYSKMAQNELALQFYQAGFFNPQMADQALACLDMMDFSGKDGIMQKIAQNGGMMRQMMMLAQMVDASHGGDEIMQGLSQQFGLGPVDKRLGETPEKNEKLGGEGRSDEATHMKKARQRVAEGATPE